jgi:hypothetical protein
MPKEFGPMYALEVTASVEDHRLVIQDPALPDHLDMARVIVLWENPGETGKRTPPPGLAGMGIEKGDILSGPSEAEWEALS